MTPSKDSISERKAVQQFFSRTAARYSNLFLDRRNGNNLCFRERLALAAEITAGISGRLLDCACGSGEITAKILASGRFTSATVVDLSPEMLALAQQRMDAELKGVGISQLDFISADIFEFATQPHIGQYDLILCLGLIAHTGRLDELLRRLSQLLSPSGSILLQSSLLDHVGIRIHRAVASERYNLQHGYRISYFHHKNILQAARHVGLEAVVMRRFAFGFPYGERLWPWVNYLLEKSMRHWAKAHGSEAIYLLQHQADQH